MPAIKLFNFTERGIEKFCFKLSIVTFLSINAFSHSSKYYRQSKFQYSRVFILMITNFMIKPIPLIKTPRYKLLF